MQFTRCVLMSRQSQTYRHRSTVHSYYIQPIRFYLKLVHVYLHLSTTISQRLEKAIKSNVRLHFVSLQIQNIKYSYLNHNVFLFPVKPPRIHYNLCQLTDRLKHINFMPIRRKTSLDESGSLEFTTTCTPYAFRCT